MPGPATRLTRRRTENGAAAVEFAFVMPILLMLVFGIIQYGLYFWAMQGGSDIARDVVRRAAVGEAALNSCADFKAEVRGEIDDFPGSEKPRLVRREFVKDPSLTRTNVDDVVVGDRVQIEVQFESHDLHLPFVPFVSDGLVTSTADARVEHVDSSAQPGLLCEQVIS